MNNTTIEYFQFKNNTKIFSKDKPFLEKIAISKTSNEIMELEFYEFQKLVFITNFNVT